MAGDPEPLLKYDDPFTHFLLRVAPSYKRPYGDDFNFADRIYNADGQIKEDYDLRWELFDEFIRELISQTNRT